MNIIEFIEETVRASYAPLYPSVFGVTPFGEMVRRKTRVREIVFGRQLCYYFMRKHSNLTLRNIGAIFNRQQDHSTVLHSVGLIIDLYDTNKKVKELVDKIESLIVEHKHIVEPDVMPEYSKSTFAPANYPQRGYLCC